MWYWYEEEHSRRAAHTLRRGRVYAMAGFSGAVKLGDLDDFIAPSQACVVALSGASGCVRRPPRRPAFFISSRAPLPARI